jgi:hypothetical protein
MANNLNTRAREQRLRRLDEISQTKLQQLMQQFGASKAAIIRQLIIQTTPEDFPTSWQKRTAEPSMPSVWQQTRNHREMTR